MAEAMLSASACGSAGVCRLWIERRHRQRRHRQQRHRRDHPRRIGGEALDAVPCAADDEGEAEHEQAVAEDRPDQRRLDDGDEPGPQARRCRRTIPAGCRAPTGARRSRPAPGGRRAAPSLVPTRLASTASATAATTNCATGGAPIRLAIPAATVATIATPSRNHSARVSIDPPLAAAVVSPISCQGGVLHRADGMTSERERVCRSNCLARGPGSARSSRGPTRPGDDRGDRDETVARVRLLRRYCRAIATLKRSSGEIRWSWSSSPRSICTQLTLPLNALPCRAVVRRDRRAGLLADVAGLVGGKRSSAPSCSTRPSPTFCAVDIERHGAALAEAAAVVLELHAHLVRARRESAASPRR